MKRSEVNAIMQQADDFIRSFGFLLPPFAYWSVDEFRRRRGEAGGILKTRLGWDITDYGRGKVRELGLFLFTGRNWVVRDLPKRRRQLYAEQITISRRGQPSPSDLHH